MLSLFAVLPLGPVLMPGANAASLIFPDALGESGFAQNDIAFLETESSGNALKVTLVFGKPLGLLDMNFGDIFIDGDLDPGTGVRIGADCIIEYILAGDYATGFLTLSNRTVKLGEEGTSTVAGTNSISFVVPLSFWGGNPNVRIFAASAWTLESTLYDRVPDAGWLDTQTGLAVFPSPGNTAVHVVQWDSASDATFPNFTGMEAKVSEGNLMLWLTFAHGVERGDLQNAGDILVIRLGLDLDKRLWTGFINGHEDPPTFGFDREINLMLSHLFNQPYGELQWQIPPDANDPTAEVLPQLTAIGLGSQSTDTRFVIGQSSRFHTSSNQIFLSIPLGYLGGDEGEMYINATAFLESTLSAGHSDSLPDAGAVDTTAGLPAGQVVHPVATCAGAETIGQDDGNDSIGFGLQGDELVSSHACALTDGGLKITADLESIEMSDLAFVNLFVDADGDVNTGVPLENATPERMGVDFYLSCRVAPTPDPGIVTALLVDFRNPPLVARPRRADQLVSLRLGGTVGSGLAGARYSITLPPEVLGPAAGANTRYMMTTTQQSYSTEDQEFTSNPEDWSGSQEFGVIGVIKVDPADVPSLLDTAPDAGFYNVPAPASLPLKLSSVTPGRGPIGGGTRATLYGSSFVRGAEVRFGGTLLPAEDVLFVSSAEMRLVTPPHGAGTVSVSVRNPNDIEILKEAAFVYGPPQVCPPVVWAAEPSLGPVGGGNTVQIHGLNFMAGAAAYFGGAPAAGENVLSPFTLSVLAPPGAPGASDIRVANSDGQSGSLKDGYNYGSRPPEVWTLFPNFGPQAGATAITIAGQNFKTGIQVRLGGAALTQLQVVSDRLMTAVTPAGALVGPAALALTNADGAGRVIPGIFNYGGPDPGLPTPGIIGVTPYSSPTEGRVEVAILGSDFQEGAAVLIDGYPVAITYFDTGLLKVTAPPHASGMVPIRVVNPDGKQATLPVHQEWDSFSYSSDEPYTWMVYPMSSPTAGGERITLYGSGFKPDAIVEFGGTRGFDLEISSDMIFATTPPHSPGIAEIKITNPNHKSYTYYGDIISGNFGFTGNAPPGPAITSVVENRGPITGGERVALQGANFFAGVRVFFGGQEATAVLRSTTTSLVVTSPPAIKLGAVDVIVRNADDQRDVLPSGYTYVATMPQISGAAPNSGPTSGGTTVTVSGAGFMRESAVAVDGNTALDVMFVDDHTLTFRTPPGFPGAAALSIVNPGGISATLDNAFSYVGSASPAPQVQAVLPASGPVAGGTAVSIIGQGFLRGLGAGVGSNALSNLEIHSTTHVTGIVPAGNPGAFDVTVTNRDGQTSSKTYGFIYIDPSAPAPQFDTIAPTAGPSTGGTDVVLSGQFLQPGARVLVGRYPLSRVEFISSREIRGQTTAGSAGEFAVRIWNPDGKTNRVGSTFKYTAGATTLTLLGPVCSGTNFSFSFQTQNGQHYTLECKNDLRATNWLAIGVMTGNGSVMPCAIPTTNLSPAFFRMRQP